jgi:hypothetical protein
MWQLRTMFMNDSERVVPINGPSLSISSCKTFVPAGIFEQRMILILRAAFLVMNVRIFENMLIGRWEGRRLLIGRFPELRILPLFFFVYFFFLLFLLITLRRFAFEVKFLVLL